MTYLPILVDCKMLSILTDEPPEVNYLLIGCAARQLAHDIAVRQLRAND